MLRNHPDKDHPYGHGKAEPIAAVIVGLSLVAAAAAIALLGRQGWESADDWAALCASLVILYNAWKQMRPALFELTDRTPDPTLEAKVRTVTGQVPGVLGFDKCFVRKMGFSYYVDLHVIVNGRISVREGHHIAHWVEDEVLSSLSQLSEVLVHIEPEEELRLKQRAGS